MYKIRKNDNVIVMKGKDRGKSGKVIAVFPDENRAIIQGINFVKRHLRRTREDQQVGIILKESPISIANLGLVCPKCNKPSRIKFTFLSDGTKVRTCKRCDEIIS